MCVFLYMYVYVYVRTRTHSPFFFVPFNNFMIITLHYMYIFALLEVWKSILEGHVLYECIKQDLVSWGHETPYANWNNKIYFNEFLINIAFNQINYVYFSAHYTFLLKKKKHNNDTHTHTQQGPDPRRTHLYLCHSSINIRVIFFSY